MQQKGNSSCTGSTGKATSRRDSARQSVMPYHNPTSTVTHQQPSSKEPSFSSPSGINQQPHHRGSTDNHVLEERSTKQGEAERQSSVDKQFQGLSISSATTATVSPPSTIAAVPTAAAAAADDDDHDHDDVPDFPQDANQASSEAYPETQASSEQQTADLRKIVSFHLNHQQQQQEQMTFPRTIQASKAMVYDVFKFTVGHIEILERLEMKEMKKVPPSMSSSSKKLYETMKHNHEGTRITVDEVSCFRFASTLISNVKFSFLPQCMRELTCAYSIILKRCTL